MGHSVLVINCGSSSVKLALYRDKTHSEPVLSALAERLDSEEASLTVEGSINHNCFG